MRKLSLWLLAALVNFSLAAQQDEQLIDENSPATPSADTIIFANAIYTADDDNPSVEAIAIQNGRFVFVGTRIESAAFSGPNTEVIDLGDVAVFPGFTDSHAHLSGIGHRELSLNLENISSLADLKTAVKNWRETHPDDSIIVARGWIETHWPESRFPSRWDIDEVVSDIPVLLGRADGHAMVANSKALELSNISSNTPIPFGGDILKNALGEVTGMFIDKAMSLLAPLMPETTAEDIDERLVKGSQVYNEYGWTGLHNMSVSWAEVEAMERLANTGELKARVYNSVDQQYANQLFQSGMRTNEDTRIITRAIKLYLDGALGSRGAALLAPYSDAPHTSGLMLSTREDVMPILVRALEDGIQVNTHAIGDRANRVLLDWYSEALETVPMLNRVIDEPRWRDEHTQIVHPEDIVRYQQLGIIPSMQPSHAIGDLHFAPARLGGERLRGAYAWSSLIASGVIVVGGSDAPVERGDPLIEFYAATARRDLEGFQGDNWHPEEALTREEALKMFTLWPAYASFQENDLGSIEVGKQADLSVFNVDLMSAIESDIPKGKAVMTMIAGEVVFRAE